MSDIESLWKCLEADPEDDTAKLALSDLYREQNQPWLAHAIRWCVENKRWPRREGDYRYRKGCWEWTHGKPTKPTKQTAVLPRSLYKPAQTAGYELTKRMGYTEQVYRYRDSLEGCVVRVAMVMEERGREWGLTVPN